MKVAATLSILAFIAASWVLGVRLLLLARSTRQAPELCMGAAMLFIGGFAYPLAILTNIPAVRGSIWGSFAFVACSWSAHAGVMSTMLFVYFVFRRDRPLVRLTVWVAGAMLLATAMWQASLAFLPLAPEQFMAKNMVPATALLTLAVLGYAWSTIESLRYWLLMRRRAALGLSDPVATNRFFLWGVAGCAMVIGAGANLFASIVTPLAVLHPLALLVTSVCGFVETSAMVLTFLPPAKYTSWVRARHAAHA